jgi:purine-nucleoside phosphorylase
MSPNAESGEVLRQIQESAAAIRARHSVTPRLGLVLGSGLGHYADTFRDKVVIPYHVPAVAMQGRVHRYEGYTMAEVAFPVRVLGALGIRQLIVTNAAGGLDPELKPGDLMLITDHINLMGGNPLIGKNIDEFGPRFPDMSEVYDPAMREIVLRAAAERGIALREGVYAGMTGPAYETPAEIRMCRILGGDAVGMSTVPEVIVASHMGIRVLGISCITNMASGMLPRRLSHAEVIETTSRVRDTLISLLRWTIPLLSRLAGP